MLLLILVLETLTMLMQDLNTSNVTVNQEEMNVNAIKFII